MINFNSNDVITKNTIDFSPFQRKQKPPPYNICMTKNFHSKLQKQMTAGAAENNSNLSAQSAISRISDCRQFESKEYHKKTKV